MAEDTTDVDETTDDTETTDLDDDVQLTAAEIKALRDENNRLKRVSAEAAKKAKDAEKAARVAAEKKAAENGDWQKLAEEREREAAEARKEAEEAAGKLSSYERTQRVTDAANRLNFRDPQDAHRFLSAEEMDDDKLVDAALKRLKKDKPYLLAEPRRSGRDGEDDTTDSGLTPEQQHGRWLASKF